MVTSVFCAPPFNVCGSSFQRSEMAPSSRSIERSTASRFKAMRTGLTSRPRRFFSGPRSRQLASGSRTLREAFNSSHRRKNVVTKARGVSCPSGSVPAAGRAALLLVSCSLKISGPRPKPRRTHRGSGNCPRACSTSAGRVSRVARLNNHASLPSAPVMRSSAMRPRWDANHV